MQSRFVASPNLAFGALFFALGCGSVALDSAAWYYGQEFYALHDQQSMLSLVQRYYAVEAFAICAVIAGAYLTYRGIQQWSSVNKPDSIRFILADSLTSRRDLKIGTLAAVVYALIYVFVSGIIVFQPGVNAGAWSGLSAFSWNAAACCGSVGTVPAVIIYLAPQAHLALQMVPFDALFAAVVPLLVGFNVVVAVHAVRIKDVRENARWVSTFGVLAGLFTGCPTCAGLFLAGVFGGVGATSLAVALAPYQMLFVVISIPLLVLSPLLVAHNARMALRAACPIPATRNSRL